jgi:Uma2 family endonuclease
MVTSEHEPIHPGEVVATADQRIVLYDVPWSQYEVLLDIRGEKSRPKMAYLAGALELMSPSVDHEAIAAVIGHLVLSYALEVGVDLQPTRAWTVRSAPRERGIEADESYTLGSFRGRAAPDLAIEVIWTSGGIDKLEIYRGLGVSEVWFWEKGAMTVFVLRGDRYERSDTSVILPRLDVKLIARLATRSVAEAVRELRASIR